MSISPFRRICLAATRRTTASGRAAVRRRQFSIEPLEGRQLLSTLLVTTTTDNGSNTAPTAGSLRAAILAADAQPAGTTTTIDFKIGTGLQMIQPPDALPQITRPVIIDGTTQPGYAGVPIIDIDGTSAGSTTRGLVVASTASGTASAPGVIRGLEINEFGGGGVSVQASDITLSTDYIGIGFRDGALDPRGNSGFGVQLSSGASSDTIMSSTIAATQGNGVVITGLGTTGNTVTGDKIGTDPTGELSILPYGLTGNTGDGVVISAGSTHNTISGSVISNSGQQGVAISGAATEFNLLTGNFIGLDASGNSPLRNSLGGVSVTSASFNTFGGTTAAARNIISFNGGPGIAFSGDSNNLIEGDFIGTNAAGNFPEGNFTNGVAFSGSINDTLGGTAAGAGDLISGNTFNGVWLTAGSTEILVAGDKIGTDQSGSTALANQWGVRIDGGAKNNTIGGTSSAARDVISGNLSMGVFISDAGTSGNFVEGDYIGTNAAGTAAIWNEINGVDIVSGATGNIVGGTTAGARDVISGNLYSGLVVADSGTSRNVVEGDYIGTDFTGTKALANGQDGVDIVSGATANIVGGTTASALDLISGSSGYGVLISGSGTESNVVEGDFIGTDVTGTKAIGNGADGVEIAAAAVANTVGGSAAGADDVISGNAIVGVYVLGVGTSNNVILGDFIGTNAAGTAAVPNAINGVDIVSGATADTVGGTTAGARDVISGNMFNGVVLAFSGTSDNVVEGDFIGTEVTGTKALPNGQSGVQIVDGATCNTVGGTAAAAIDLISGNAGAGVFIFAQGTSDNVVEGDLVGTSAAGTAAVANGANGVEIASGATANTVGGTTAAARDVISGNEGDGVVLESSGTESNVVEGAYIGTDLTGTRALGNAEDGVAIYGGATFNTVGGTTAGARDIISGNASVGVYLLAQARRRMLWRGITSARAFSARRRFPTPSTASTSSPARRRTRWAVRPRAPAT